MIVYLMNADSGAYICRQTAWCQPLSVAPSCASTLWLLNLAFNFKYKETWKATSYVTKCLIILMAPDDALLLYSHETAHTALIASFNLNFCTMPIT